MVLVGKDVLVKRWLQKSGQDMAMAGIKGRLWEGWEMTTTSFRTKRGRGGTKDNAKA